MHCSYTAGYAPKIVHISASQELRFWGEQLLLAQKIFILAKLSNLYNKSIHYSPHLYHTKNFKFSIVLLHNVFQLNILCSNLIKQQLINPHLRGRGTIWYSQSEWLFLPKFLCTNIVKQFVFLVQSIVFIHMFLNLWNNNAFISF